MSLQVPRRAAPLATQLVEQVRALILSGEWAVGSKIPGEIELAESVGVSRNSMREALRSLVHSGLLESRAGDGTYVISSNEIQAVINRRVNNYPISEFYEVRSLFEERGAFLAAIHSTPEDLERIRGALSRRDAAESAEEYVQNDVEFHRAVVRASKNELLVELYESIDHLASHISDMVQTLDHFLGESNAALNAKHHDLVDAIATRNPEAAAMLASELLVIAEQSHGTSESADD